ncbi:MAG: carbohydrate-binding protein [Sedimentisphaerales bacterium]
MKKNVIIVLLTVAVSVATAREYHVSVSGNDMHKGTAAKPLRTISAAARLAQPGDLITVHEGVYRERINPLRGGKSDNKRIVYQTAPGEKVLIKGSEVIKEWQKVQNDTWEVSIPNSFFGGFNPYSNLIHGDWFNPKGRDHHTGAVYLNGHWLTEAAKLDDVLKPIGQASSSYTPGSSGTLLNVAWLQPGKGSEKAGRVKANSFVAQHGIRKAPCSEGGECIGWIEQGDWVRYEKVDFGQRCGLIEIRAASATRGGIIEIRLDAPDGELLGTCSVPNTGGWQSWTSFNAKINPVSGIKTLCLVFRGPQSEDVRNILLWFAQVDSSNTTIRAQFKGVNPNEAEVEINVRQAVFYPEKPGINYITVRGFTMEHAATPWAPPTAEQIGLIGTHWSKGWIIENNVIRYSVCTGITLGKHGDEFDNTSQNSAEGYVKTIERATARGWSKQNIGHHIVRNNHISHCEQAGIVGSMGPVFSTVTGNTIHDIYVRRLFTGAEMAGIKFHGAVDTLISRNHIYRTCRGIWLDWMTQGTRVTRNLLHDNGPSEDLFVEVNHGPFLVDNNILLSGNGILVNSQGAAYVHNLIAGRIQVAVGERRLTPYLKAHSTEVARLHGNASGDERYYNNIFVNVGLPAYDPAKLPVFMAGNVFLKGAKPSKYESNPLVQPNVNPGIKLVEKADGMYLEITLDKVWAQQQRQVVTTDLLGKARIPDLPYEQPDGSPYRIDTDYSGKRRNTANPFPGPFELPEGGSHVLKAWPAAAMPE